MKPYEERKARERMAAGGGDKKSGGADLHHPIADAGRTAEKLAEKGQRQARRLAPLGQTGNVRPNTGEFGKFGVGANRNLVRIQTRFFVLRPASMLARPRLRLNDACAAPG